MNIILTGHFNAFITLSWGNEEERKNTAQVLSPVYRIVWEGIW